MRYDPDDRDSRENLAVAILSKLHACGFILTPARDGTREAVYQLEVKGTDGKILVLVYTTAIAGPKGPECRKVGADALRVCAIYKAKDGRERGLVSAEHRVNRVGEISDIVTRMYDRMREVYKAAMTGSRCHCGAPKFKSTKGNEVCADLCFVPVQDRFSPGSHPNPHLPFRARSRP